MSRASVTTLRQALLERNEEHGTEFYVLMNEDQAQQVASGYVPRTVRAMVTTMLDWLDEDERRAYAHAQPKRRRTR